MTGALEIVLVPEEWRQREPEGLALFKRSGNGVEPKIKMDQERFNQGLESYIDRSDKNGTYHPRPYVNVRGDSQAHDDPE